jgi:hypothetical protein
MLMANNAEQMRQMLTLLESTEKEHVEENMLARGASKLARRGVNWLSKKFGDIGLDWRSVAQYQVPQTLRLFERWMRLKRQDWSTVTWFTVQEFFTRNSALQNIRITDDVSATLLTREQLASIFNTEKQLLRNILKDDPTKLASLPKNASDFVAKAASKKLVAPMPAESSQRRAPTVGGTPPTTSPAPTSVANNPDHAYSMVVAVIETAIVHMFMMSQPEQASPGDTTATGAAPPARSTPAASVAPTSRPAPGPSPAPARAAAGTQGVTLTATSTDLLRRILPDDGGSVTIPPNLVSLLRGELTR